MRPTWCLAARQRIAACERGQALVETAVTLPLLLLVAIGLVQFALFYHAGNVVAGAAQDGARVAAAENRSVADGVAHARSVLHAGLGDAAGDVRLHGRDLGDAVAVEAEGRLRTIIPWVADSSLPLSARAVVSKEHFRSGATR